MANDSDVEITINALLAENDKFKKLLDWQANELERLRSALRGIRDYKGNFPVIYDGDDAIAMKEIARAALGEKE